VNKFATNAGALAGSLELIANATIRHVNIAPCHNFFMQIEPISSSHVRACD
jgi:hypothetical protein